MHGDNINLAKQKLKKPTRIVSVEVVLETKRQFNFQIIFKSISKLLEYCPMVNCPTTWTKEKINKDKRSKDFYLSWNLSHIWYH